VSKFIFWSLLCINGLLLAYSQGMLGNFKGNEREPARMKAQLNTDKLVMLSAASARAAAAPPAPADAETAACFEVGNLAQAEARRFEARLAPLELGDHMSHQNIAATEVTSHIVYIPPQGSKEAADRKANELKNLGVANYFIMADNTPMKWAISLGVFKSEEGAQALLAALNKQGVHSARISGRGAQSSKLAYQFRGVDPAAKAKIEDIAGSFASLETRSCK
jgi:hypothetical protein